MRIGYSADPKVPLDNIMMIMRIIWMQFFCKSSRYNRPAFDFLRLNIEILLIGKKDLIAYVYVSDKADKEVSPFSERTMLMSKYCGTQ